MKGIVEKSNFYQLPASPLHCLPISENKGVFKEAHPVLRPFEGEGRSHFGTRSVQGSRRA